jgi:hypothetical protein
MSSSTISRAGCVSQTRWAAPGPLPDRSVGSQLADRHQRSLSGPANTTS